ncbi:MAG: hypothetical protein COB53_10690 [Elusimicrobia bacterium]|nr:MAG: hypothetical protein COB53_10690 [Elusimicrobiota bacterium]
MEILIIVLGVAVPFAFWKWREANALNPSEAWPELAPFLEFKFADNPARLDGQWKGHNMRFTFDENAGEAVLQVGVRGQAGMRLELGTKAAIETEAGMIVHDRVELNDPNFEQRYVLRSTPKEIGEAAFDPNVRQQVADLPDLRILAQGETLNIRIEPIVDADQIRALFDVAASVADSIN